MRGRDRRNKRYRILRDWIRTGAVATPEEAKEKWTALVRETAAKQGWRASELAMTLVSDYDVIDDVFQKGVPTT